MDIPHHADASSLKFYWLGIRLTVWQRPLCIEYGVICIQDVLILIITSITDMAAGALVFVVNGIILRLFMIGPYIMDMNQDLPLIVKITMEITAQKIVDGSIWLFNLIIEVLIAESHIMAIQKLSRSGRVYLECIKVL